MAELAAFIPAALSVGSMLFGQQATDTKQAGAQIQVQGADLQAQGARDASRAALVAARRRKAATEFEAQQFDINAGQQVAAAQRTASDNIFQAKLLNSRAIAVAAAGGGGVSDTTIVNNMARTTAMGAYRASVAIYAGEDRARTLRAQAGATRYQGDVALEAGDITSKAYLRQAEGYDLQARGYDTQGRAIGAAGTAQLLAGGASLFSKYGMPAASSSSTAYTTGSMTSESAAALPW